MLKWLPCEIEGVASAMAINACSNWILASNKPTYVTPDCKAVVEAVERMRQGKLSRNPRLQMILISINRRPVIFIHSSAKTGQHAIPDFASRMDITCGSENCAVERFLDDMPDNVQCMGITSVTDLFKDSSPCIIASTSNELMSVLENSDQLPLGDQSVWKHIQESDPDLATVYNLLSTGDSPRKHSSRTVKTIFKHATLNNDLITVKESDSNLFKDIHRIVLPKSKIMPILSIIHLKGNHPSKFQSEKVFLRYFFCPGFKDKLEDFYDQCFICQTSKTIQKEMVSFRSPNPPEHPGMKMNADVIKRAGQTILVNTDVFSSYVTSSIINSEKACDLEKGLIQVITPIKLSRHVSVRVDSAPGFKSLAANSQALSKLGIHLDIGNPINKNSNCHVDKVIQDLEKEISKSKTPTERITPSDLAKATETLNRKIRNSGMSPIEILFMRENETMDHMSFKDHMIQQKKKEQQIKVHNRRNVNTKSDDFAPGDLVLLKANPPKHTRRQPFIVVGSDGEDLEIRKLLNLTNERKPRLSHVKYKIPPDRVFSSQTGILANNRKEIPQSQSSNSWNPNTDFYDTDSDTDNEEDTKQNFHELQPCNITINCSLSQELPNPPSPIQSTNNTSSAIPDPYLIQRQIFERQLMLSRLSETRANFYDVYKSTESLNKQIVRGNRSDIVHPSLFPRNLTPSPNVSEDESTQCSPDKTKHRKSKAKAKKKIRDCYNLPQLDGNTTQEIYSDQEKCSPPNETILPRIPLRKKSDSVSQVEDLMETNLNRRLFSTTDPNFLDTDF